MCIGGLRLIPAFLARSVSCILGCESSYHRRTTESTGNEIVWCGHEKEIPCEFLRSLVNISSTEQLGVLLLTLLDGILVHRRQSVSIISQVVPSIFPDRVAPVVPILNNAIYLINHSSVNRVVCFLSMVDSVVHSLNNWLLSVERCCESNTAIVWNTEAGHDRTRAFRGFLPALRF